MADGRDRCRARLQRDQDPAQVAVVVQVLHRPCAARHEHRVDGVRVDLGGARGRPGHRLVQAVLLQRCGHAIWGGQGDVGSGRREDLVRIDELLCPETAGSVLPSFMVHFAAPVSAISTVVIVSLPQLPRTVLSVHDQACRRDDLRVQDQPGSRWYRSGTTRQARYLDLSADLDPRKLRYFLAVAHHLNFGRAAEVLLLAQPAPSRAIQALETDFGVTLFERDHHKVALTPPGAALVREAETLLARAAAARRHIQAASRPTSTLTVGFRPGIIITDIVQQFTREHPETEVNAIRIEWDEQHAAVADGRVDIAWIRTPSPVPTSWLPRFSMTRKWSLSRLPPASPAAIPSAWLTWPASRCRATTPRPGTRPGTRLRNAGSGPWRKSSRLSRWATASP